MMFSEPEFYKEWWNQAKPKRAKPKLRFMFAWYDFWIGLFWDKKKRILYVFPIPMFGFRIEFPPRVNFIGHFLEGKLDHEATWGPTGKLTGVDIVEKKPRYDYIKNRMKEFSDGCPTCGHEPCICRTPLI